MNTFLPLATIVIFIIWQGYWVITGVQAERAKPFRKPRTPIMYLKRLLVPSAGLIIFLQLISVISILPISQTNIIPLIGFALVCIGTGISFRARKDIGDNWAHAAEYQIKKDHALITKGIYQFIRHPIYTGLILALTGASLVGQSYIAFIIFLVGGLVGYIQAKSEEKILTDYFGPKYKQYIKHSNMFIPHLL